jgi:hypothetical protein
MPTYPHTRVMCGDIGGALVAGMGRHFERQVLEIITRRTAAWRSFAGVAMPYSNPLLDRGPRGASNSWQRRVFQRMSEALGCKEVTVNRFEVRHGSS